MAKIKEKQPVNPINGDELESVVPGTLLRSIAHKILGTEINQYFIKTNDESYPVVELSDGKFYGANIADDYIFIQVAGQLTLEN